MSRELKPCPFCGGKAVIVSNTTAYHMFTYRAICSSCKAQMGYRNHCYDGRGKLFFETKEEAIEAWNRRVTE